MSRIFIVEDDPGISGAIEKQTNAWGMDAGVQRIFMRLWQNLQRMNLIWF